MPCTGTAPGRPEVAPCAIPFSGCICHEAGCVHARLGRHARPESLAVSDGCRTLGLCLVQTFALMSRDEIVVLVPPELSAEMEVAGSHADQDYTKAWGLHIATLIGNVTPGNGAFIKESVYPLLSPEVHDQVTTIIERQLDQLDRHRVALRFEPRRVVQKGKRVFVFGYGVTSSPSAARSKSAPSGPMRSSWRSSGTGR